MVHPWRCKPLNNLCSQTAHHGPCSCSSQGEKSWQMPACMDWSSPASFLKERLGETDSVRPHLVQLHLNIDLFKLSQCHCHLSFPQGWKWCIGRKPTVSSATLVAGSHALAETCRHPEWRNQKRRRKIRGHVAIQLVREGERWQFSQSFHIRGEIGEWLLF